MSKIYIDGSGWNGKVSKYCVAFADGRIVKEILKDEKTNNVMEYTALLKALEECDSRDTILTDSQLLVGQVTKGWNVTKEHLFPLVMKAKMLVEQKNVTLQWIPRNENYAGGLLEAKW